MKKTSLALLTALASSTLLAQTTLFSGTTGTVYKATTNNTDMALVHTAGTITLTNNSAVNEGGYIWGNFTPTTLSSVGDAVTVGFTVSNIQAGANPLYVSLSTRRDWAETTADVTYQGFSRRIAGFSALQSVSSSSIAVNRWTGGSLTSNTSDRNLQTGTGATSQLGSFNTATGDRFDVGKNADITFSVFRASATELRLDYSVHMEGGNLQSFSSNLWAPVGGSDTQFHMDSPLSMFSVGYANGGDSIRMDPTSVLTISDLSVTFNAIPEPGTLALLGLALIGLLHYRRRRG